MNSTALQSAYEEYSSYTLEEIKSDLPGFNGALSFFIEQICNCNGVTLKNFIQRATEKDLFLPAPWIKLIIIQNAMLKIPHDQEFFVWASHHLRLFYDSLAPFILEVDNLAKLHND
jgi:hypothetical protein